jgi:hypothetical protein
MRQLQFEINEQGYLILPKNVSTEFFPEDACVAIMRGVELWILPIHNKNSGGFLMKQRNVEGDRSVLIHEVLPAGWKKGKFPAFWDAENGALRIALKDA